MAHEQCAVNLFSNKMHREQVEVEALILYLLQTQGSMKKTKLKGLVNTNGKLFRDYTEELLVRGLVVYDGDLFHITETGRKYLEAYGNMRTIRFSTRKGTEAQ